MKEIFQSYEFMHSLSFAEPLDISTEMRKDMEFFRNPEIKRELIISFCCMIFSVAILYLLCGLTAGITALVISLSFISIHITENYRRYLRIQEIGQQIDRLLHGEDISLLEDCREGDLSVLSTQIDKMVSRLKEQSAILSDEKVFLADSLADISHQIKTPLTSMGLILSFLKEENLSTERRYELVQDLTKLTDRIDWLIYALLRMSKLDAGAVTLQKETISVQELVGHAYDSIAVSLDIRGIDFVKTIEEDACITGDADWWTEAIANILKNCMEHTPAGGQIKVTAKENALYTVLYIEDTGDGIAAEDLPHIFERFYRGKNADSGSVGIGLALSRKIITSQNGTIKAMNLKGGNGAAFEIRSYKSVI